MRPPYLQGVCFQQAHISTKSEYRNPKWFDTLTTLSHVEGQAQISNDQNPKRRLIDGVIGFVSVI
jgi:hypothetical protein